MRKPRVVILGAGPAGLAAAACLARRNCTEVVLLESDSHVGGIAGSFDLAGLQVDYGSHRLHPSCDPEILHDLREMLGSDLADRIRHGRIRLRGRWIHFPLKPLDLALRLPLGFSTGVAADLARKRLPGTSNHRNGGSFASVLEAGLGRTISREFYFPYSKKLWGLPPQELAAIQAERRVSSNSVGKMLRKVLAVVPGPRTRRKDFFYYPKRGFGQICEAYSNAAVSSGATIQLDSSVTEVETLDGAVRAVHYESEGRKETVEADFVWSTIPITTLIRSLQPRPPASVLESASSIDYRAMILVYLVLSQERFSEYDAHYFPELEIPISRLSEPKNFHPSDRSAGSTVICAELPCTAGGPEWRMSDEELGQLVRRSLELAGIPIQVPVEQVKSRRLRHAYPIYRRDYGTSLRRMDEYVHQIDGLLSFGRQGLFAHDNAHHALHMGYAAAHCLNPAGRFDHDAWRAHRRKFETHVVED